MFSNKWAVLVGVKKYKRVRSLDYSSSDAVKMAKALQQELSFPEENILTLCDDTDYDPKHNEIFIELQNTADKVRSNDLFFFYFSGHGMSHKQEDFLLSSDSSKTSLRHTALSMTHIAEILESSNCKNVVSFIDACRDKFDSSKSVSSVGECSRNILERAGITTFFSCKEGVKSYEVPKLEQGAFTHCLLDAIRDESIITVDEIDTYLKKEVPEVAKELGTQFPLLILNELDKAKQRAPIFQLATVQLSSDVEELQKRFDDLMLGDDSAPLQDSEKDFLTIYDKGAAILEDMLNSLLLSEEDRMKYSLIKSVCGKDRVALERFLARWRRIDGRADQRSSGAGSRQSGRHQK